jgi:zinc-ribbon domain
MKFCPQCGTQNVDEAQVCTNCGRPFAPSPQMAQAAAPPPTPSAPLASAAPPAPALASVSIRPDILAIVASFGLGALVLLVLIIVSLVGDSTSDNVLVARGITTSLINLYVFGLALYAAYYLVVHGVDLSKVFGHLSVWARLLLIGIVSYLLYLFGMFVAGRLLQFVFSRGSSATFLVEQLFEGLLVVLVAGIIVWRLSQHPAR